MFDSYPRIQLVVLSNHPFFQVRSKLIMAWCYGRRGTHSDDTCSNFHFKRCNSTKCDGDYLTHSHTCTHIYIYIKYVYIPGWSTTELRRLPRRPRPQPRCPRPRCPRPRCPRIRRAPRGQRKCLRPRQRVGSQGWVLRHANLKFEYI